MFLVFLQMNATQDFPSPGYRRVPRYTFHVLMSPITPRQDFFPAKLLQLWRWAGELMWMIGFWLVVGLLLIISVIIILVKEPAHTLGIRLVIILTSCTSFCWVGAFCSAWCSLMCFLPRFDVLKTQGVTRTSGCCWAKSAISYLSHKVSKTIQDPPRTICFLLQPSPPQIQIHPFAQRPPRSITCLSISSIYSWLSH